MLNQWVVVAENGRARIFSFNNLAETLEEHEDIIDTRSRIHARNIENDRAGRSFDSVGRGRHALGKEHDTKQHAATVFARQIGDRLELGRSNGEFESLILVSSLPFLGTLRKSLGASTTKSIVKTVSKNLVQKPTDEIATYLR